MVVEMPSIDGRGMTMSDLLARWARTASASAAVRFDGGGLSYAELDKRVNRLAWALDGRRIAAGDRVAVLAVNCLELFETYLACARMGAITVPINFRLVADEVAHILADSGASALIVHRSQREVATKACASLPELRALMVTGDSGDARFESYEGALASVPSTRFEAEVAEDMPAIIMYTSGTTGRPKGATLTHGNLLMHVFSQVIHLGWAPDDRISGGAVPLFHIAGFAGCLPPLLLGGTNVIMPSGGFDPVATLDLIERERISNIFLVPSMLAAIVEVPDIRERDLSCLRRITWGAAPATKTLLLKVMETFPQVELVSGLGQTECSPGTCHLRGVDALRKIGSVGTPMLNVEVRIVDHEMNDVAQGEVGEIVYRSPMVMKEYWNQPEATAEAFRGGWFHSGDLVRQDEDGYIYVVDRLKDMIISGGENIYSAEVEDVLAAHPKVVEVAIIGKPDPQWTETPVAVVQSYDPLDPLTPADLAAWCEDRLASYKWPRFMAIVDELPRNTSGKILKSQLRAEDAAGALELQPVRRERP